MSSPVATAASTAPAPLSRDSELAAEVKALVAAGKRDAARERFSEIVALLQRRAARIAYQYLRDLHDADEAVHAAAASGACAAAGDRLAPRRASGDLAQWLHRRLCAATRS
jgi:DNA-directed RNA polymerase specialized sigma24 family protein